MSASSYEWVRNWCGLMYLRESCSRACWMSDAAWTEWRNYSLPRFNYVAWLPESTPFWIFRSATLGTLSLFSSASTRYEMSSLALKNVRRLRTSKSLTSDALNVELGRHSGCATTRWSSSGFDTEDWKASGTICWQFSGRGNGKQRLIDEYVPTGKTLWDSEDADILADVRAFIQRDDFHKYGTRDWYVVNGELY